MEVNIKADFETKLSELSAKTGRTVNDLIGEAVAVYLDEQARLRVTPDGRIDEIKSGRAKVIDEKEAFALLREESTRRRDSTG